MEAFRGITRRAILTGLALIPLNVYWILRLEWTLYGPYVSTISLFPNAVFLLLMLVGGNALLRRLAPARAFSQAELLTSYLMVAVSTGIAGVDGVPILNQMIPHGAWYGALAGRWSDFLGAFPDWLVISDPEAVRGHYLGNSTFYTAKHLRAWAVPILAWTLFVLLAFWTVQCLNVLVRRQWQDRERLSFPILWLPLEMTDPSTRFFFNRLMWGGFAIAAGLGLYNGLAFLYPSLPMLPIRAYDLKPYFTEKPWNAIDWFPITLYPFVIGLGFLLPLDLLFSCWFFFLFWKAQMVVAGLSARDVTPDAPFIREQGFGAILGLACYYLWTGRRVFADAWKEAFAAKEALPYRAAFGGLFAGLAGMLAFFLAGGMTPWLAAAALLLYFALVFVILRIRAELGPPVHDFHFIGPDRMLPRAFGVSGWRQSDLAMLTLFWFCNRAHRGDVAPIGLESLVAAHRRGWHPGRMFWTMLLAAVVSALCAFWLYEHLAYRMGEASRFAYTSWAATEAFQKLEGWAGGTLDAKPHLLAVSAMGGGLLACGALLWMRLHLPGFPLHPIGYAISSSWSIHLVWLPLLVAWLFKSLTLRWGGMRAYRRFQPFFLGLLLGDCVQGSLWSLVSLLFDMRTYSFFGE